MPKKATEAELKSDIEAAQHLLDACDTGIKLTHKIAERPYTERARDRAHLMAHRAKLKQKVARLQTRLSVLAGPMIHKDIFGQELKIGATIAWSPSGRYAGATVGYVSRSTPKMIQMVRSKANVGKTGSGIYPQNVIVVDKLIGGTVWEKT